MKKGKIFSGYDSLPDAMASDEITQGCMVLEGGAFRRLYGEGVLDALMEADINMQCTIGISAGAMNGFSYCAGHLVALADGIKCLDGGCCEKVP